MKTVVILSQKGGSGKSTIAVHLCAMARFAGHQAGLIDLDPQGSSYEWNQMRKQDDPHYPKLEALHSDTEKLAALQQLPEARKLDLLIVDTAPRADRAAVIAAKCADFVLMPCRPASFDLMAVAATARIVHLAGKPGAAVLNAAPHGRVLIEEARAALTAQNIPVLPGVIHQRAAFSHALIDGRAVHEYEPQGKAAQEMARLYVDIVGNLGITQRRKNTMTQAFKELAA